MDRHEERGEQATLCIDERIRQVNFTIGQACAKSDRRVEDVHVVAVTKYVSTDTAQKAVDHGLLHIGENRWQDAKPKWERFGARCTWHFIGHLQTNKVKDVIGKFTYIHSLDRLSLARELNKRAEAMDIRQKCFVQINISGEQTKYGLSPQEVVPFLKEAAQCRHLHLIGLMTMAPHEPEPEATRPVFRALRQLREDINQSAILPDELEHLSMGMSNDYHIAIEEGATWVRLGSVLVGKP